MMAKKFIPKHFVCPECGSKSISVLGMDKSVAIVRCGNCGIEKEVPKKGIYEPVDVFGDFIDLYNREKGIDPSYKPEKTNSKEGIKKEKTLKEMFGDNTGYLEK